jgi:hypothetical protein
MLPQVGNGRSLKAATALDGCELPKIGTQFGAGIGTVQKIKAAINAI